MTSQAKKVWAAFTTAFFALVAMLGFAAPARTAAAVPASPEQPADLPVTSAPAAQMPAARIPAARTAPGTAGRAPVVPLAWRAMPKDRSLPPTIKQRIRAEAHGSTPGARHLPLDLDASSDDAITEAAVGTAVLQPA
ncbi:DUF6344 domain-containing protein [Streptomyces sp. NBC_00344]|uniref:DUF6344 domain-containing protein n=1 Tax=Streptomyces sp. NBC_00344 TaxID=2975720 RepID=UPI002E22BEAF